MKNFYFILSFFSFSLFVAGQNKEDINVNEITAIQRISSSNELITTDAPAKALLKTALSGVNNPTGTSTEVGETDGQLSVSLNGNASYTIPILIPKGINNIEPQINLTYNSQNGISGNAARGWDVSGVSSITRIPATKFHDGIIDPVDFNALDRFALDGQRLIVKSGTGGVYGADRTVYETEYFSNIKITSYGVSPFGSNYGPAYFLVEYPDGTKAYYGYSTNSRSIMEWSILYFDNNQGVRITYNYILLNNTLYIDSIKYGVLGNNVNSNEVKFIYEDRSVSDNHYVGGQNVIRAKRLKEIKSLTNGIGFRNYSFSFISSDRLEKVTETSGDGTKRYNPIVFDYGMPSEQMKYLDITTGLNVGNINSLNIEAVSGDFDGDGKMDCLVYPTIGADAKAKYWLYAGIETGNNYNIGLEHKTGIFEAVFPATFLGKNSEVLPQGWVVAKKAASDYTFSVYGMSRLLGNINIEKHYDRIVSLPTNISKKIISGDFDGDGLTDVLAIDNGDSNKKVYFIDLKRNNATTFLAGELSTVLLGGSKIEVADFNGDGRSDLYVFYNGFLTIYSLDATNKLVTLYKNTVLDKAFLTGTPTPILIGDYNGDGKSDIMIPKGYGLPQWYKYTSTGSTLIKEEKTYLPVFNKNDSNTTYNYIATDYNNDGKTDLIEVLNFVANNKGYINIYSYSNMNGDFTNQPKDASTGGKTDINIYALPVFLPQSLNSSSSAANKVNSTLEIAFFNQNKIHFFNSGGDFKKQTLITNITTGNGVEEAISYIPLDTQFANTYQYTNIYKPSKGISIYPNVDIIIDPNLYIVSKLEKQSKDVYKKKLFTYYGAVSNLEGLGFMGFRSVSQTDWYNDSTAMFSSITKNDIELRGASVENYFVQGFREPLITTLDIKTPSTIVKGQGVDYTVTQSDNLVATESIVLKPNTLIKSGSTFSAKIKEGANDSPNTPTDYITKSISKYESNLLANKVFRLKNTTTKQFNTLNNTNSEEYTDYDAYDNPLKSTTILKEGASRVQTTVVDVAYDSDPLASPYIIGRPSSKSQSISVAGSTMSSEEIYDYNAVGLLKQTKKEGTNTNYITEDNEFDIFGNIRRKRITAVGLVPREINYEYDSSGRFLIKITDNEKHSTSFVYNPNGTLQSETNPYNLTTSYTYDPWFKKLTTTDDKLDKTITYVYTKNAEKTVISTITDVLDGSASEETFDDLGRKIKSGQKDLNGNFSYVSFIYDVFDRNYKTSEPYFGGNPSQWNETKFDIYSRPTESQLFTTRTTSVLYDGLKSSITDGQKTKSFIKNAIGNIISSTETTGGTIGYDYFADGNLKQTNYNGVKIAIEQDGWGRKTKLTDPSAGVFTYKNNDLGELETETSKNGEVVTTITRDNNGKPIKKTVTGSGTRTITVYESDPSTQLLVKTIFTDKNEPAGSNEIVTTYTYDDVFKRVSKIVEDKTGISKFTTTFGYDGLGRIDTETKQAQLGSKISNITTKREYRNSSLYQIVDNTTKKVLWQTNVLNAKGQILESVVGNGIKTTSEYDSNDYLKKIQYDKSGGQGTVLTLNTAFDFKTDNLENRTNSAFSNYTETFKYDEIDRLKEFTNKLGVQETQNYEPSGKIKDNSLGVYDYSKDKPYQNTAIALTPEALNYYKNRKAIASQTAKIPTPVDSPIALNITYNAFKAPLTIDETGGDRKDIDKISFTYNDDNNRSTMFYAGIQVQKELRALRKHYSADGTMEIKENIVTGIAEFITYIGGDGYSAPIVLKSDGVNTANYLYLHRDYQGSILAITDANANVVEKRLFDAWGSIIKVEDGAGNKLAGLTVLDRGYTGHEHLQSVGLINMNARLYDPMLHRFLQVDNYIQDVTNTQNYNQYGYVLNNPLLYTDPSGNAFNDGKDCVNCGGTNNPVYNPDKMQDNPLLADAIKGWVGGWASARNIDEAGTAVGKAARDVGNFIGRNIRSLFGGGHKSSGPPVNRSNYVSLNNQNSNINVNSTKGSLPCTGDCDGWLGTEYIGPTPTSTFYRRETPVDMVDVAAQKHDAGYIFIGADGIIGATVDVRVIEYDRILVRDAKKVYSDYYNYGIDTQTRLPISFQTQLRAAGVVTLFTQLIQLKQGLLNLRTTYQGFIFSKNQFFSTLYF